MKKFIGLLFFICLSFSSYSQNYNTGIGIRGGLSGGLSVKHFIGAGSALEGILFTRWAGFGITGLYEIHREISAPNFDWYYGFGGHIGFWDGYDDHPYFDDGKSYTVIGVDGIIGIEYTFEVIPLNLSLDWKPALNLSGYSGFWGDEFALSIRYVW